MAPYNQRSYNTGFSGITERLQPNIAFIVLIFGALIAFEIFNFSTTDHALTDILGDLNFAGIAWATILAVAFCGIDFAGIARLFTPEQGGDEPREVWYLFAAWLLAATMNAVLTWWGVSMAVASHAAQNSTVVDPQTMGNIVPVFVAVLVWLIRILIIGTLSMSLDHYFHPAGTNAMSLNTSGTMRHDRPLPRQQPMQAARPQAMPQMSQRTAGIQSVSAQSRQAGAQRPNRGQAAHALPARDTQDPFAGLDMDPDFEDEAAQPVRNNRPEPSYHTLSMSARPAHQRGGGQNESGEGGGLKSNNGNSGPNRARRY